MRSRLAWGVWVEICCHWGQYQGSKVTPRMRRVSWNPKVLDKFMGRYQSRLAWGVWVEMLQMVSKTILGWVTPRMRRVSWNKPWSSANSCIAWSRLAWGVWVEIWSIKTFTPLSRGSRLAWGVWVEIDDRPPESRRNGVTPRMRRVSWNS